MKGNGLERDTLSGVIEALEKVDKKWQSSKNQMNYADFRDALWYLHEYQRLLGQHLDEKLIDVLRKVRNEE